MAKRAANVRGTRQRIVEATVHLHETLGLAATTVAGVAEAAGVSRLTVYRHFPDTDALFEACSAHWAAGQVLPDPHAWAAIGSPEERLRAGLTDLYRFYRDGHAMLVRVYADKEHLPQRVREQLSGAEGQQVESLLGAFPYKARGPLLRAAISHAASFWTWHSLCAERGLRNQDAVEMMTRLAMSLVQAKVS
jgi:AcrR family transcriptional regulator